MSASDITVALSDLLRSAPPAVVAELEAIIRAPTAPSPSPGAAHGDPTRHPDDLSPLPDGTFLRSPEALTATSDDAPDRPDLSHLWVSQPGPQTDAYYSKADILLYGGQAGGGKSDLLLGLALTAHQRAVIYRKEAAQCQDFVDRLTSDVLQADKGWSGQRMAWDLSQVTGFRGHKLSFGGLANPGDEQKYKGRPNDFLGFDEAVDFQEFQVRFLSTWNRSTLPGQRCRMVLATNPPAPTTGKQGASGLWLLDFFAPWLDPEYKDPLGLGRPAHGDLRWYVRMPGTVRDQEHPDGVPFLHPHPTTGDLEECLPQSRTFIGASVEDNAYLRGTSYVTMLHSLPEPYRSIMLEGDFAQALSDQPAALFPASWVRDAVSRSKAMDNVTPHPRTTPMTALGLDVARGGADQAVAAPRHGAFFDTLHKAPGVTMPDGPSGAAFAVKHARDGATVVVDANGPGGAVYDHLHKSLQINCRAYVGSTKATGRDRTGKFGFVNLRSQAYWKLREALDPSTPGEICLPDDTDLVAELLAHTFEIVSGKYKIIPKEQVQQALGRSPDSADAVVMAWTEPHETSWLPARGSRRPARGSDGYSRQRNSNAIDYGRDRTI